MNIKDIYQKKRITAQEVYDLPRPEQRQVIIKGFELAKRNYKDEEYKFIRLHVDWNGVERLLDLKEVNAEEIARVAGTDPNNWAGYVLQLQAIKEQGSDYAKLLVFCSQSQPTRNNEPSQDLEIQDLFK